MNNRKVWFAICCAVSFGFRIYDNAHGRTDETPLLFVPLMVGWVAFLLPAMVPVILIEEGAFHFEPWSEGHNMTTILWMALLACLIWFFPPRIARWFGTFDAVSGEGKRRWPSPVRGVAHVFDALNKRLFGRQKTGGWA